MSTPMLKLTLPAGAILGGMLHLGEGVFVKPAILPAPGKPHPFGEVATSVLEGRGDGPVSDVQTELWDGRIPEQRTVALIQWPDGQTEGAFYRANGIEPDEHLARVNAAYPQR